MDAEAAKLLGAGFAAIGCGLAALGVAIRAALRRGRCNQAYRAMALGDAPENRAILAAPCGLAGRWGLPT